MFGFPEPYLGLLVQYEGFLEPFSVLLLPNEGFLEATFFSELLRQSGEKRKLPVKMRFFHSDPHKKSTKRVLRAFLAEKNSRSSIFIFLFFFLDQLFFSKNCYDTNPKTKNFTKNLTLNTEDVREKPYPKP